MLHPAKQVCLSRHDFSSCLGAKTYSKFIEDAPSCSHWDPKEPPWPCGIPSTPGDSSHYNLVKFRWILCRGEQTISIGRSASSRLSTAFDGAPNTKSRRNGILSDANVNLAKVILANGELTAFLAVTWPGKLLIGPESLTLSLYSGVSNQPITKEMVHPEFESATIRKECNPNPFRIMKPPCLGMAGE